MHHVLAYDIGGRFYTIALVKLSLSYGQTQRRLDIQEPFRLVVVPIILVF